MKTTFSLQSIITEILIEKGSEDTPEKIRKVRRSFDALLARLGSDKAILKIQNKESSDGKKSRNHEVMLFDEFEKPMIKTLLLQLMDKKVSYINSHIQNITKQVFPLQKYFLLLFPHPLLPR